MKDAVDLMTGPRSTYKDIHRPSRLTRDTIVGKTIRITVPDRMKSYRQYYTICFVVRSYDSAIDGVRVQSVDGRIRSCFDWSLLQLAIREGRINVT